MDLYPAFLSACVLVGALCAGFVLAQSPERRATQLAALLGLCGSWWALSEAFWNSAATASVAAHWMRLSAPGWAFIAGLLPHLVDRYFDEYPMRDLGRERRWLPWATRSGYALGLVVMLCAFAGVGVHGPPQRVPWGWTYAPGPVQIAFMMSVGPPITIALVVVARALRSSMSVAPRVQRIAVRVGIATPLVLITVTELMLPVAGIHFPRLGGAAYSLFGLVALGSGLRYGLSFFTPNLFSEEILDTLHDGVAMVTPSGAIRRANRGLGLLVGQAPGSLIGVQLQCILRWQLPGEFVAVEEEDGKLLAADGITIPVSVSAAPLRDRADNLMGLVVVLRDLREIEDLRRRMFTQARLAAVGELAAGLAHEINNPLAFVRANLGQLERHWESLCAGDLSAGELQLTARDGREMIQESMIGADRAVEIVRGVRRFTHAGFSNRELADPNELIEDTLSMLRSESNPTTIDFRRGEIPPVLCEPQQLRQVFLNLVNNALQAVSQGGRIEIASGREGDDVVVEVSDDGEGMDAATLDRIFDPFFTTKEVGEGTGLGLAISWHIVSAHGGRIDVRSTPGNGSRFYVRLPIKGVEDVAEARPNPV